MKDCQKINFYHDFKKISLVVWKRILQDLLNYHAIVNDLEWMESLEKEYTELKVYLKYNGLLPDEAKEMSLIETISLIKEQIKELEDLNSNTDISKKRINDLKNDLIKNEDELLFFNTYIKNNRFIYNNNLSSNQMFEKRKKALLIHEKSLINLIDEANYSKRSLLRKKEQLKKRVSNAVVFDSFNFDKLYVYIKPYIDIIISTPDNGYDYLQKNLYLDY